MTSALLLRKAGSFGVGLTLVGVAGVLVSSWMAFFWVPTEAAMGIVQRIFYIHVPAAWIAELAFCLTALASAAYLWLGDERADAAAVASAEGGLCFGVILLIAGPLWAKVAWGTYWTWEPRLTFTLLLWFIYFGYFIVRESAQSPERGKRLAAVVAIVGVLDIPIIHMSVYWFRSLHPQPVVMKPEGPTAESEMLVTLFASLAAYTILFFGLLHMRYATEIAEREWLTTSRRRAAR